MRVLLVNTSEYTGGASIAANRLMKALNRNGVEAEMLVRDRKTQNPRVVALPASPLLKAKFLWERFSIMLNNRFSKENLFALDPGICGNDITRLPVFERADVIHLHWVNQAMLSLADIRKIVQSGKPVVWTLHDMWACTGICHQADTCEGWLHACGHCPMLKAGGSHDLSYRTFIRKQQLYAASKIHFVTCSDWLADICRQSPLLQGKSVTSIPNPIDVQLFSPGDKRAARIQLSLPTDKLIVLFVAYKATDKNKGIDYLIEAMRLLREHNPQLTDRIALVTVGREANLLRDRFACESYPFEYVGSEQEMLQFYRAADLLAMPTLMDNLPNTVVEAMACGLPCVASRVGGLPQMITHGVDGYLSRLRDAEDFSKGLEFVLTSPDFARMGTAARTKVLHTYSEEAVVRRYLEVYENV